MPDVFTQFTPEAERAIGTDKGVYAFSYQEVVPQVGDVLELRFSPSRRRLRFVCVERRFDFASEEDVPAFHAVFDLASDQEGR